MKLEVIKKTALNLLYINIIGSIFLKVNAGHNNSPRPATGEIRHISNGQRRAKRLPMNLKNPYLSSDTIRFKLLVVR